MYIAAIWIDGSFYASKPWLSTKRRVCRWTSLKAALASLGLLLTQSRVALSTYSQGEIQQVREIAHVESWFKDKSLADVNSSLDRLRPEPVNQFDKTLLIQNLPSLIVQHRVNQNSQLRKLHQRLATTLKVYNRDGIVDLIIFRHSEPIVISNPGVVLAFSSEILRVIGDDDAALIGVAAHELAHEYVALEFLQAIQGNNLSRMRELELFCDAIAVVVLIILRLDPSHYARALRHIATYTNTAAELNDGTKSHPAIEVRLVVISHISAMFSPSSSRLRQK